MNTTPIQGFNKQRGKIPVLNATEYGVLVNEAFAAGGETPPFNDLTALGVGTDWQDEVFENAPIQNHSIIMRGGTEKAGYSYSGSFFNPRWYYRR